MLACVMHTANGFFSPPFLPMYKLVPLLKYNNGLFSLLLAGHAHRPWCLRAAPCVMHTANGILFHHLFQWTNWCHCWNSTMVCFHWWWLKMHTGPDLHFSSCLFKASHSTNPLLCDWLTLQRPIWGRAIGDILVFEACTMCYDVLIAASIVKILCICF